ncbi:twin-arginine translocation signal domain-containing protein [Parabacteroides distasonis]|uniref:Twin-arginine translocation signal domain-containing protein n=8 Tax=Bacteroidales TaxID=171549 RepID=A0A413B6C9_BACSE|nr:twin-arginine translocation signal domain-containing protein [Phocaeicola vulgatus]MBC5606567.1 twin-arginine translocation signal domain-containing protein [Bacteroides difficilis]MBC5607872.1 twin-arginine translocation signal domain-containing protein [Bacteroides sp. NSJ-48]MBE3052027.1 twin-arginine translocation signal domain-containing protein [Bacteroides fragilis]MBS7572822.1 twin-arginine translocation signal domain-containing protein [Bacteroides propionicigenes]MBV3102852.1 twin
MRRRSHGRRNFLKMAGIAGGTMTENDY